MRAPASPLYLPYISPTSPLHLPSQVLELVRAGVLTMEEVEQVIGIEFNPVRCGFAGGEDVWLTDVLNVGVKPEVLVASP